jgi:hypothetical protein
MIPVPERMAHLERDARGYPIPWIVMRDLDGRPHFTINDTLKVERALKEERCAICGGKLFRGRWFLGGPAAAFHPNGAYIDPPLHHECMTFAVQVCPYLARRNYSGRIDALTVDPAKIAGMAIFMDETQDPTRPEYFVAVMAIGQTVTESGYLQPKRPYRAVEVWRHGVKLDEPGRVARLMFEAARIDETAPRQEPRLVRPAAR